MYDRCQDCQLLWTSSQIKLAWYRLKWLHKAAKRLNIKLGGPERPWTWTLMLTW